MLEFTYTWVHIASGRTGTKTAKYVCILDLYEDINRWNKLGQGRWLYWV